MKTRRWLLLLLIMIVATMSLATYTGVTTSLFTDGELSTDNALSISWTLPTALLTDGFEDTDPPGPPWDDLWNGNGLTTWTQDTTPVNNGSYSATTDKNTNGWLTSDDVDASSEASLTVSFWYYPKGIDPGDLLIKYFNDGAWVTLFDITDHPDFSNMTWCRFSEIITDAVDGFEIDFKIAFDSTGLTGGGEYINVDDVLITVN